MTRPEPRRPDDAARAPDSKPSRGADAAQFGGEAPKIVVHASTRQNTFLAVAFGLAIFGVPLGQVGYELTSHRRVQALDYFAPFTHGPGDRAATTWARELASDVTSAPRLRHFEEELHNASFLHEFVQPWYQWSLTKCFGFGNERVFAGRDDWLFFADDLASVYGKGYLEPGMGGHAALDAIADFKRQLDAREPPVQLLLIPSFSKEMVDPEELGRSTAHLRHAQNPDLEKLYAEFDRRGWPYVRMQPLFDECRKRQGVDDARLAMARDTHWTPPTMAHCAKRIAERALTMLGESRLQKPLFTTRDKSIESSGDLFRMLGLPSSNSLYAPMKLVVEQVVDAASGELEHPDPWSEVLLMGDSLTKVFSDPSLGAGECAGLAEHLSLNMDMPIDVIALPGGSATATREALARRPNGLDEKKRLVIWQFGVRMLENASEWQLVPLPEPKSDVGSTEDVPKDKVTVEAELVAISAIPPGFLYDLALAVFKYRVLKVVDGRLDDEFVYVAIPVIQKNQDTKARSFKPGVRHRLVLDDLRNHYNTERDYLQDDVGDVKTRYLCPVVEPEEIH